MQSTPTAAVVVRAYNGVPFYEAKWRDAEGVQRKRRLGRAWLLPDGDGWKRRPGRTPQGFLDERTKHVAAMEKVSEIEAEERETREARAEAERLTFRRLSREWLTWKREVKDASAKTIEDNESTLAEPGTPYRRWHGRTREGRVMRAFGPRDPAAITPREWTQFFNALSRAVSPRTVNKTREVVHAVYEYGKRPDTYALETNPVTSTDVRPLKKVNHVDYYEVDEVEAVASALERGLHRPVRTYKGRPVSLREAELKAREWENARDADLIRVKFFCALRLGEVLAMRRGQVSLAPDLSGVLVNVDRAVSADTEKAPKSGEDRFVVGPRQAAEAFARALESSPFQGPDDYAFCNRSGERLDASSLRKRYKAAARATELRVLRLHRLRHAGGSILARRAPLVLVRDILGHADLSTTNQYLHGKINAGTLDTVNAAFAQHGQPGRFEIFVPQPDAGLTDPPGAAT